MKNYLLLIFLFLLSICLFSCNTKNHKKKIEQNSISNVDSSRSNNVNNSVKTKNKESYVRKINTEEIIGNWVRPDGGYILNIKKFNSNKTITAEYLNPKSINISETEWKRENGNVYFYIKFDDEGYPGSYYSLVYNYEEDSLVGIYYQATMQQQYEVYFVRK